MKTKTKLAFTLLITCFSHLSYSGPCYTDTGDCGTNDQIITVKSKKEGDGFCTEYINDNNEKTTKCYHQPQVKANVGEATPSTKIVSGNDSTNVPQKTEINFIYNPPPEPTSWGYSNSSYRNRDYTTDDDSYYFYRADDRYNNGYYYHPPRPPRPPRPHPNPETNRRPTGITITKGGGHDNINRVPVKERPSRPRPNMSGGHSSGNSGNFNHHGNSNNNSGRTQGGGRARVID